MNHHQYREPQDNDVRQGIDEKEEEKRSCLEAISIQHARSFLWALQDCMHLTHDSAPLKELTSTLALAFAAAKNHIGKP